MLKATLKSYPQKAKWQVKNRNHAKVEMTEMMLR